MVQLSWLNYHLLGEKLTTGHIFAGVGHRLQPKWGLDFESKKGIGKFFDIHFEIIVKSN